MRKLSSNHSTASLADHDLLRRFVLDADESAFVEVVCRHQRLVMGICRRVTGNQSDVEDAFQAVFLALTRRPRSIRRESSLSAWLYTVSLRISQRVARHQSKRTMGTLEQPVLSEETDPLEKIANDQQAVVLHEEIRGLPERYREVLVMAYFADQTSQQIADQLRLTKGTVDGRIRQARNVLRVRLARRGVALSALAAATTALTSSAAMAGTTPTLLHSTIQLGTQTLTKSVPGTTDLSHIERFIQPENSIMSLKSAAATTVCVLVVVGVAGMGHQGGTAEGQQPSSVITTTKDVDESARSDAPVSAITNIAPLADGTDDSGLSGVSANTVKENPLDRDVAQSRSMSDVLNQPIPLLDFQGPTPLSEILGFLAGHFSGTDGIGEDGRSSRSAISIWEDSASLRDAGIESLNEVMVEDIHLSNVSFRDALDLIFSRTESLAWDAHGRTLTVTSRDAFERDPGFKSSRMYVLANEVSDLDTLIIEHLAARGIQFRDKTATVQEPAGGAITMPPDGDVLIVTHHRLAHQSVTDFLKELRVLQSNAPKPRDPTGIDAAAAAPIGGEHRADSGYIRFDKRPLVCNIHGNRMTRYVNLSIILQVDPEIWGLASQRLAEHRVALKDGLLSHLADKTVEQLTGSGRQKQLQNEIRDLFNEIMFPNQDGRVDAILFDEFAIQ